MLKNIKYLTTLVLVVLLACSSVTALESTKTIHLDDTLGENVKPNPLGAKWTLTGMFEINPYYRSEVGFSITDGEIDIAGCYPNVLYGDPQVFIYTCPASQNPSPVPTARMTKAVVDFSKEVNGKSQTSTKIFKEGSEGWQNSSPGYEWILYEPKNGFKPYKATMEVEHIER